MRLIDADAMKERLGMARDGLQCDDCDDPRACRYDSIYTKRDFCLCIDDEPTVEERKTGKWLRTEAWPHRIYCSACFVTFIRNDEFLRLGDIPHNYCPNCGAKMENDHE